jgi:hypothetical protein
MVPLEKVLKKPAPRSEPLFIPPKRAPRAPAPVRPRAPRRFRIVDVATRVVLADDVGARETLEALGDVRSSVDVHVFIRDGDEWQLLSLAEQRTMWERRAGQ